MTDTGRFSDGWTSRPPLSKTLGPPFGPLLGLLLALTLALTLGGCAGRGPGVQPPRAPVAEDVADLREIPQDPRALLADNARSDELLLSAEAARGLAGDYARRFFRPWTVRAQPAISAPRGWLERYERAPGFGENLRRRDPAFVRGLAENADLTAFPSLGPQGQTAIAVRHADLRQLPTAKPLFDDPARPGQGFPFDDAQQTAIWGGTPLRLWHVSRDGAWGYVTSSVAEGWLAMDALALADEAFVREWSSLPLAVVLPPIQTPGESDDLPLIDATGVFRLMGRTGVILPMRAGAQASALLVPVADENRRALAMECPVAPESAVTLGQPMTPRALADVAARLMGRAYGWGGLFGERDCSALMRDVLAPFGVWLPRNSAAQAKHGRFAGVKELSPARKERMLLDEGVPGLTLVWLRGHVMLYMGSWKGRPVVLHAIWGLRTAQAGPEALDDDAPGQSQSGQSAPEGRLVIGQTVLTTLTPGAELPQVRRSLLERVEGFGILGGR